MRLKSLGVGSDQLGIPVNSKAKSTLPKASKNVKNLVL